MGNQPSSASSGDNNNHSEHGGRSAAVRHFIRSNNALGLTKAELDERCKPSGLYPSCHWEEKAIRRLIGDGKIAARMMGAEKCLHTNDKECPICFLWYSEINLTKCCHGTVCTECYLQIRPQKEKWSVCPFCNHPKLQVLVPKPEEGNKKDRRNKGHQSIQKTASQDTTAEEEEEGVSAQPTAEEAATASTATKPTSAASVSPAAASSEGALAEQAPEGEVDGFGSSLAKNERVALLRARSSSFQSDEHSEIKACAMTPAERRALEEEMKAQNYHPLSQRLQAEEAERRLQNEREYYNNLRTQQLQQQHNHYGSMPSQIGSWNSAARMNRRRDFLRAMQAANGPSGASHNSSTSNLRSRRRTADPEGPWMGWGAGSGSASRTRDWNRIVDAFENSGNGSTIQSLDDLVVLEAAIMLSMEEEARRREGGGNEDGGSAGGRGGASTAAASGASSSFDAAHHARQGFPLAVNRFGGGYPAGVLRVPNEDGDDAAARRLRAVRAGLRMAAPHHTTTPTNNNDYGQQPPSYLVGGMSEEEQMAMAIAASLADLQKQDNKKEEEENGQAAASSSTASENETTTKTATEKTPAETDSSSHDVSVPDSNNATGPKETAAPEVDSGVASAANTFSTSAGAVASLAHVDNAHSVAAAAAAADNDVDDDDDDELNVAPEEESPASIGEKSPEDVEIPCSTDDIKPAATMETTKMSASMDEQPEQGKEQQELVSTESATATTTTTS